MYIYIYSIFTIYVSATVPPGTGGVILMFWQLLVLVTGFWFSFRDTHTPFQVILHNFFAARVIFSQLLKQHVLLNFQIHFFNDFGADLGCILDPKTFPKWLKTYLLSDLGKTTEKYPPQGWKWTPSNLKNIAKTMEGCSESHFSHISNEPEKRSQDLSVLKCFWIPNPPRVRKKIVSKSL